MKYKYLIKKNVFFSAMLLLFLTFSIFLYTSFSNKKNDIESILKNEYYSYLPVEAKEYVRMIYKETGEVILTERNKEDNKPYLNPDYINYLKLSDEEKEKVALIPDANILDYSINENYTATDLPSSFDLRNIDGRNFVSPIKDQETTSVCWAFASIENVETLYMKSNKQSYSDTVPSFSVRQMDYITSTRYEDSSNSISYLVYDADWITCSGSCSWTAWNNPDNGSHELGKGGNFYTSSIAMANAITLTDESVLPWTVENEPVWAKEIYGFDKSLFEVDSTIVIPTINEDSVSTQMINSYVTEVKSYMIKYGGPFVGTYSPTSTCGFENTDGTKALKVDDCYKSTSNSGMGHAMQIIGWDDNYQYSYCDTGLDHYSVGSDGNCSNGDLVTGKGAWILKNSWGTENEELKSYSYIYLTYDSTRMSVGFTTSISDMKSRIWDNNYHSNPWIGRKISNGMVSVDFQTIEFNTHNNGAEKIEKIKFLTASRNGKYNVTILTGDDMYEGVASITTNEIGIYTIDLSSKNIVLNDKIFSVKISSENGTQIFKDSISVFTSNVDDTPSIETNLISGFTMYDNPEGFPSEENVAYVLGARDTTLKLEFYLKNISDYTKISYKALLDGVDHSKYFFNDYSLINRNMIYLDGHVASSFKASEEDYSDVEVCGKTYTFQILYDGEVIEDFPLKRICLNWDGSSTDYTQSTVRFHSNDEKDYVSEVKKNDTMTFSIMKSNGTGDSYIGDGKKFFRNDKYIKGWNTKPDGSGTTYIDDSVFVYKDMDLYAQWSDPATEKHTYIINWECNRYVCDESDILSITTHPTFDVKETVPVNTFTNLTDGQEFIYWSFDQDDLSNVFYEEEQIANITQYGFDSPYNNDNTEYLEAVWSDSYNSVTFDPNNGSGSMKGIKIIKDRTARLKYNLYERAGYTFVGWNTKADGTGTAYTDGEQISINDDITLYAQWEVNKIKVTFYANNGTAESFEQDLPEIILTALPKNTFKNTGHEFIGWNTKADGSGTSYLDEQEISITEEISLYAQWSPEKYELTFDSNGGTGSMDKQTFTYNVPSNLLEFNFAKDGFAFKEWNTKADGSGTSYRNRESIKISSDTTLYAIWVEGPGYLINNYPVDDTNKNIDLIPHGTEVNEFKNNFNLNSDYKVEVESKSVNGKEVLYTGGKTKIFRNNELVNEYTNIIRGDVSGDGQINYMDYVKVYNHIYKTNHSSSNKKLLVNVYLIAGDLSDDDKITYMDYVKIYNKIKGK